MSDESQRGKGVPYEVTIKGKDGQVAAQVLRDDDLHGVWMGSLAAVALFREQILRDLHPEGVGSVSDGYHTFDELYEHRHMLFMMLMYSRCQDAWYSRAHSDGSVMEGWFVAGIKLQTGMITYHLPDRLWEYAEMSNGVELERAPEWDGHTSKDVVERMKNFLKQ